MTTCEQAVLGIHAGKNATSVLERLELQGVIDHATNCGCGICRPALLDFYGIVTPTDLVEVES